MLHVQINPVSKSRAPGSYGMNMHMVDVPPRLCLSPILEHISYLKMADSEQPGSHTGIDVACIAAVEEPYQENSANA